MVRHSLYLPGRVHRHAEISVTADTKLGLANAFQDLRPDGGPKRPKMVVASAEVAAPSPVYAGRF